MFARSLFGLALVLLPSAAFAQSAPLSIPKLPAIHIDSDPGDWGDRGMRFDVLTEAAPSRRPYADHDATVRLGWVDKGVVVRVDVTDASPSESPNAKTLWDGDSVELFILPTARDATGFLQLVASPGNDATMTPLRTQVIDQRPADLKAKPVGEQIGSTRTETGYVIEMLVPWEALGGKADTLRLQIHVNDRDRGQQSVSSLLLFPTKFGRKRDNTIEVKLADEPSEPVRMAASAGTERWRRLRVNVAVTPDVKATNAIVNGLTLSNVQLPQPQEGQRLRTASVVIPLRPEMAFEPIKVGVDTQLIRTITLPDPAKARANAIAELQVVASPSVFDRPSFPTIDFDSPAEAEDLIGQYTINTRFFDAEFVEVAAPTRPGRYGAIVKITSESGGELTRFVTLYRTPGRLNWRGEEISGTTSLPPAYGVNADVLKQRSREVAGFTTQIMRGAAREGDALAVMLAGLSEIKPGDEPAVARTGPLARNQSWWHDLQTRTETLVPYQYVVSTPKNFPGQGGTWPLILFLHGSGERGIDLKLVGVNGPARYFNGTREQPFIIVSPQCPQGQWWDPIRLHDLLEEIMTKYPIDPDRIYLTGLSMGGFGAWDLALREPERFAALAPVCGGGDDLDVARIKNLPTWVFHGAKDDTVLPEESHRMVGALREQKGRVRYTLYPEADHNSWTVTYNNPKLYEWMLAQKRGVPAEPEATAPGTQPSE